MILLALHIPSDRGNPWQGIKELTYVRVVSAAVQVDTVPTRWEECLRPHAFALLGREGVAVRHGVAVEANVRDGLVLEARVIVSAGECQHCEAKHQDCSCSKYVPSVWISNQHDEALRRCNGKRG